MHRPIDVSTGELLRQRVLGSESVYRVIEVGGGDGVVTVEVLEAPGLACGARVRITGGAARSMRRHQDEVARAGLASPPPRLGYAAGLPIPR